MNSVVDTPISTLLGDFEGLLFSLFPHFTLNAKHLSEMHDLSSPILDVNTIVQNCHTEHGKKHNKL